MKIVIDIPEDTYLLCKSLPMDDIQKAIANGIPLSNCETCKNFDSSDRYCKLLQINWLPEDFGCNKYAEYKENENDK